MSLVAALWNLLCRVACNCWTLDRLVRWFRRWTTPYTTVGNYQVQVGRKLAEGGFSYVFEATDRQGCRYALKRLHCPEAEHRLAAQAEADVHYAVAGRPHVMELLGMSFENNNNYNSKGSTCWMLFPLYTHSLRDVVNRRTGLWWSGRGNANNASHHHQGGNRHHPYPHATINNDNGTAYKEPAPWPEVRALQIFHGILLGLQALHGAGYTHRDVKLENVLMMDDRDHHRDEPVLMDFGSAGTLTVDIGSSSGGRRLALRNLVEQAAQHTTLPYRPPELLEGGIRAGDDDDDNNILDYRAVDVWSAGCTLFALLFGASPFEGEFSRQTGRFRVTDCTALSILKDVPQPTGVSATWYSPGVLQLIKDMLIADRTRRITLNQAMLRLRQLITEQGGNWQQQSTGFSDFFIQEDAFVNHKKSELQEGNDNMNAIGRDNGDNYDEEAAGGIALLSRHR